MTEINLVDPGLNNYHHKTILSIQLSLDGFSFAINSSVDKQLRAFRHYKFTQSTTQEDMLNQAHEILQKDELLRLPHKEVRVIYTDRKSTLLPNEFLDEKNLKSVLEFNQPIDDLDEIHLNPIKQCHSNLIFTVSSYFAGLIADKFNAFCFYNQATPVILKNLDETKSYYPQVFVQLNKGFFDIVIIKNGQLKLQNSFLYVDANDLLYFILYACKQLKVDPKNADIFIIGEYISNKNLLKEVNNYLKTRLPEATNSYDLNTNFSKLNHNRFYSLLNLVYCES